MANNIKCPNCGTDIELTEALTDQIEHEMKAQFQKQADKQGQELKKQKQLLEKKAEELAEKQAGVDEQVSERLKAERKKISEVERKKVIAEQEDATQALKQELAEKSSKLSAANKKELSLLKHQQELEEKSENIDLEVQRKIAGSRKKILAEATEKAAEQQMLKLREKDDLIKTMQEKLESLKRRAELGSQEAQGEALEEELKDLLIREFPFDRIDEVKKGARGADIVQAIHNGSGNECGKILWETKNTKDFQKPWIEKLKKDQQQAQADIAVLMSVALPAGIKSFGLHEGIWITDYKSSTGLAAALRQGIILASRQKAITAGRNSIKDVVYDYITSQEFSLHISSVVNSYKQMQADLEKEKNAMARIWKKRDKQISTVLENVSGMYGSIEGIVGTQKALPAIDVLELENITEE